MDISEFPLCLKKDNVSDRPMTAAQFMRSHNLVIMEWAKNPTANCIHRNERAILSLATGIHQFIMSNEHISLCAPEGSVMENDYYACDIVKSLLNAFTDALNYDLGRLDCGMLSEWCVTVHKAVTGEDM